MKIRKPRWETNLEEIIYGNIGGIIMSVDMFGITDSVMKHRDATLAEIKKLIHKELKKPRSL